MKGIKETGIIMSGNHPKMVIDGLKTMTRRTWGLEEINKNPDRYSNPDVYEGITGEWFAWFHDKESGNPMIVKCPYGGIGDLLWVRETWMLFGFGTASRVFIHYKASEDTNGDERLLERHTDKPLYPSLKWHSARFMPKVYSRLTLEITGVRVERLQEITEADARAEGCSPKLCEEENMTEPATIEFEELWDSINGKKYPWSSNPWAFVIQFDNIGVRVKGA